METRMISPFDNPVPEGYIRRIEEYARDLVWGIEHGLWDSQLRTIETWIFPNVSGISSSVAIQWGEHTIQGQKFELSDKIPPSVQPFFDKWHEKSLIPLIRDLALLKYIEEDNQLSLKSFDLLRRPILTPKVFISYHRAASSAFALAIEARLRLVGHHDIFIDKDIEAGDEWLKVLKERIANCEYFVFLVDQDVFSSPWMCEEYELAVAQNKNIIPMIHPEVDLSKFDKDFLAIQFIECRGKTSASSYEDAINRLLSRLGYPTY